MADINEYIAQRYQLWLSHASSLYDFCTNHVLEYPSHTVAWLSDSRRAIPLRDYAIAQVAVGTICRSTNYVLVYRCFLRATVNTEDVYTEDELQTFSEYQGQFGDVSALMQRHCRFAHDGPVTLISPLPQRPQVLAVRGRKNFISIVDIGRRRAEPEDEVPRPDMRLKGHRCHGYGMEWNPAEEGTIATGAADQSIQVYRLEAQIDQCGTRPTVDIDAVDHLHGHTDVVEGVSWHRLHSTVLASCGWDKTIRIWDLRADSRAQQCETVHRDAVHSVSFHPSASFVLATASADKSVRIWDMRNFHQPVAQLVGHSGTVYGVRWSPFSDSVLLSYGADREVNCWDIEKIGQGNTSESGSVPLELVFKHTGHTAEVREASWAPFAEDEWCVASVDDNNNLMFWAPKEDIYNDEVEKENYVAEIG